MNLFHTERVVRRVPVDRWIGGFHMGDARSFFGLTSKIALLGSMINFDTDVKRNDRASPNVKATIVERDTRRATASANGRATYDVGDVDVRGTQGRNVQRNSA